LIDDYAAWLRKEITTTNFGEYNELTTPYLDRFNDHLQIYAKQDPNGTITLTDDGYIIGSLISSGTVYTYDFHLQRTKERPERFCKGFDKLNISKRDLTLFNWMDTQEKRGDLSELIVIYNDENSVSDDVLTGFYNYGIKILPFSQRQEHRYLQLFAA